MHTSERAVKTAEQDSRLKAGPTGETGTQKSISICSPLIVSDGGKAYLGLSLGWSLSEAMPPTPDSHH